MDARTSPLTLQGRLLIRSRPHFEVFSARRPDGSCCTLITPGPKADRARAARAFEGLERIQNLVDHPRVARVSGRGSLDGEPYVELDFPAVADALEIVELLNARAIRQPYGPADSFIASLRAALGAANAVTDPRTGGPLCLGRIGYGNVLFAADGRWSLFGFGRNLPLERDDGSIDPAAMAFHAPELSSGGAPSPTGDFVALLMLMRSLLPWVEFPDALGRVLRGELTADDLPLIELLQWTEERMVSCLPALRATVDEAVEVAGRIRELLGSSLDEPAYEAFIRGLLSDTEEPSLLEAKDPAHAQELVLGPGAAWIGTPDGARHRLGRPYRRLLLALVEARERQPGAGLSVHDLIAAGGPGEKPVADSGKNRCYVALSRLRALGLRDVICRIDDGYVLAPGTRVVRAE